MTAGVLSIVGYGNYSAARRTVMEALVDKAGTNVQSTAGNLASWIDTRRAEVEVMSRTDQVRFGSGAIAWTTSAMKSTAPPRRSNPSASRIRPAGRS